MLGIALDIWRPAIYGGGFTPASLFTAGQLGLWYDASDIATLYQDSAGSTPVTAVTQTVGKQNDKSGRGNHATQATAGARPTYNSSSGVYYLTFDGVDDALSTGAITLGADMDCFIAVRRNSSAAGVLFSRTVGSSSAYFGYFESGGAFGSAVGVGTPTHVVNGVDVGGASATAGDISAALIVGEFVILEVRNLNLSGWTALHLSAYTALSTNVGIPEIVLCPAGDAAQRQRIRTYLGAKVGLTL